MFKSSIGMVQYSYVCFSKNKEMVRRMSKERFALYDPETLDTHIEDREDLWDSGSPKTYWYGDNEDFCNLFKLLVDLDYQYKSYKNKVQNELQKHYNGFIMSNSTTDMLQEIAKALGVLLK